MSQPNSTSSFDEGQSPDSGVGSSPCPSTSPLSVSELACSASYSHGEESGERHMRRMQSEYRAPKHLPVETPSELRPHNSVHFADQDALSSCPTSTPSVGLDGRSTNTRNTPVPTRPQTPYPSQRKVDLDDTSDNEDLDKVLGTPTEKIQLLRSAPRLELDLAKPLVTVSSQSTLDSGEGNGEKEEIETERCSITKTGGNILRASTPIPSLAPPIDNGQPHKANGSFPYYQQIQQAGLCKLTRAPGMPPPRPHQVYTVQSPSSPSLEEQSSSPISQIPSLLRVLDANLHPQPHFLTPLAERVGEL